MTKETTPQRIPLYVVVPPHVLLLDVAGPIEVVRKANLVQRQVHFDVVYIGPMRQVGSSIGIRLAGIRRLPATLPDDALIVVPGHTREPLGDAVATTMQDRAQEAAIVAWLRAAVRPGMRVVTICSGALLAGRAGLLDGFECTTHHECAEELSQVAPQAIVRENRLYVEDRDRLSSAGITAGIDLMLHMVARLAGAPAAVVVARFLVVYLRRAGKGPQLSPWLEGRNHVHPSIHRAQDAVSGDPSRAWTVAAMAREAATSSRHLSRLFNEHTGMSVTAYVNRMRLALASELLAGSRLDMDAVAERAGFASARQLRRAWGRLHGTPPSRSRGALG